MNKSLRRTGWWLSLLLAAWTANDSACSAAAAESPPSKLAGLLHNEDCTNFFYFQDFPAGQAGEIVDRYVDVLAGAGVTVLMCNTNARRTNYRSDVWDAFWDGYDPRGPDEQPYLAAVPQAGRKVYRKLVGNMLEVHRQGVDYPARVIQRCRQQGISPWISLRMNDVHENDNLDHPFHAALWRKPELFRQGHPGYYARALDYAHPEVREHYQALIAETLARYDIDGLELDFLREPYLFSKGKEQEGRTLLTDLAAGHPPTRGRRRRASRSRGEAGCAGSVLSRHGARPGAGRPGVGQGRVGGSCRGCASLAVAGV